MEKSRLLVPLLATVALTSVDDAHADERSPKSAEARRFCAELKDAQGPDIKDYVAYFAPDNHGIQMTIERAIRTVMEDGQEVTLSCVYDATKGRGRLNFPGEGIPPVESFSKDLFLPTGQAFRLTATTPGAEYGDSDMDSFPDYVNFTSLSQIDSYYEGIDDLDIAAWEAPPPCVEGQAPDVCAELNVGLDDFDAAIAAGRKALGMSSTFESPDTESSF